jgi:DNA-binding protein YbaB
MKSMEEMIQAAQEAAQTIQTQMNETQAKLLEDLVTAAFNDARDKADRKSSEEMERVQGSMGLPPGFNLPGMG